MEPNQKQINTFIYGGPVLTGGLFYWHFAKHGWTGLTFFFAALLALFTYTLLVSFINREWVMPVFNRWMVVAMFIGNIITTIIMGLIFYLVFSPVGILFRIIGKDHLDRKIEPEKSSYWKIREKVPFDRERCTKQF